jgi:hypothetical protein
MIVETISDLQQFIIFFIILIVFLSSILNVIASNHEDEYKEIGFYFANLFTIIRFSLGDFNNV